MGENRTIGPYKCSIKDSVSVDIFKKFLKIYQYGNTAVNLLVYSASRKQQHQRHQGRQHKSKQHNTFPFWRSILRSRLCCLSTHNYYTRADRLCTQYTQLLYTIQMLAKCIASQGWVVLQKIFSFISCPMIGVMLFDHFRHNCRIPTNSPRRSRLCRDKHVVYSGEVLDYVVWLHNL